MRHWLLFIGSWIWILFGTWCLGFGASTASAVYDPLSVPNNKFGVHILEPSEVFEAAKLVNSQGGKWGYVTIPIRTDDRDKTKWTNFMQHCRLNFLIPILRISSYATGNNWASPPVSELTDFANFLNDLPWPVTNRYIIVYNEPNHAQEWGGYISPGEYASLLQTAHEIFKSRSQDYFLLSAGLDMSAPTTATSLDALRYYRLMTQANKNWYSAIDGLSVHAYPNPAFIASVWSASRYGIISYRYETNLLRSLGFLPKPIFITETGYLGTGEFYRQAFTQIWTDSNLVAVTPFVLFAGAGDFLRFSLLNRQYQPTTGYTDILSLPKTAGSPLLSDSHSPVPTGLSFTSGQAPEQSQSNFFKKILSFFFPPKPLLTVGQVNVKVDIADNPYTGSHGLSGRKSLAADSGMLFKFTDSALRTFWMNGMLFSLDFIWIRNGQIVNFHQAIPPPAETGGRPVIVTSSVPVDQVLEVPAGFITTHQLKIGDPVMLNSP